MKVKDLIELLSNFDDESEVVVQTQTRHALYADISSNIERYEYDAPDDEISKEQPDILIMGIWREGYSPEQALGNK